MITILVFYKYLYSKSYIDELILNQDNYSDKHSCIFKNIRESKPKNIKLSIKNHISELLNFEFSSKTILNLPFNSHVDAIDYFKCLSNFLNTLNKIDQIIVYVQYLSINRELIYSCCTKNKHFQNKIRKYYPQIYLETDYSEYTDSEETLNNVTLPKNSDEKRHRCVKDYSTMKIRRSERLKLKILP